MKTSGVRMAITGRLASHMPRTGSRVLARIQCENLRVWDPQPISPLARLCTVYIGGQKGLSLFVRHRIRLSGALAVTA